MRTMSNLLAAAAVAALLPLAACNSEPETITTGPADPQAAELAKAPPVELPPAIVASKTYRCKDNSLIYVDFFSNQTKANFRKEKGGEPTVLTAPAAGEPFTDGKITITGSGDQITAALPGKGSQSCKA